MNAHAANIHWGSYVQQVWDLRHFWISLVKIDVQSRYRGSVLGIGWSLVRPLGMCIVLCLVFSKVFNVDPAQYAPMLLVGLTCWQFLTEAMLSGCDAFKSGRAYIRQVPMPLVVFPLRTVLVAGFHAAIAMSLAVGLNVYFNGVHVLIGAVWMLPALALMFFAALALAVLCGLAHTHFPDTAHILQIVTQILFYLTPIIYPAEVLRQRGRLTQMLELNPFSYFIEAVRYPVTSGNMPPLYTLLMCGVFTLLFGVFAAWSLKKLERTLVFWI